MWARACRSQGRARNNFEEAVERIKSGATALGVGAAVFIIIFLMSMGVWLLQNDAGAFFTLVPVLAFAIPATIIGLVRLNRSYKALSAKYRGAGKTIQQSKTTDVQRTVVATTDSLDESAQMLGSVTEHTTLNLESPEHTSEDAHRPQS